MKNQIKLLLLRTYNINTFFHMDAIFFPIALTTSITFFVLYIVIMWKIFEKADEEGWKALIPVYNTITLLKIVGKPWWWMLLLIIPIVNLVIAIIAIHRLSRSFGFSTGFTVGLIFLPIIFSAILGFGKCKYTKLED